MKRLFLFILFLLVVGFIYFGMATKWTYRPLYAVDYFNLQASSLLRGHIDLLAPPVTHDLIAYNGKWFIPWGLLGSLFFIPLQVIKGRYVPGIYVTVFFASIHVYVLFALLKRLKDEFFSRVALWQVGLYTVLFAFGTAQFYVGSLGSVWHVSQMTAVVIADIGLFAVLKAKRHVSDYIIATAAIALAMQGRVTLGVLAVIPIWLLVHDVGMKQGAWRRYLAVCLPLGMGVIGVMFYNLARFGSIWETGYRYILEAPNLAAIRTGNGMFSVRNIPNNFYYMFLALPSFVWDKGVHIRFNLYGSSILFLTPALAASFAALRHFDEKNLRLLVKASWVGILVSFIPILTYYSTGWMQFGYRYSLDFLFPIFFIMFAGLRGKTPAWFIISIIFSIILYAMGISSLQ